MLLNFIIWQRILIKNAFTILVRPSCAVEFAAKNERKMYFPGWGCRWRRSLDHAMHRCSSTCNHTHI